MNRLLLLSYALAMTLTLSAQEDMVSVADSIYSAEEVVHRVDSFMPCPSDTIVVSNERKKDNWFKRAYRFVDGVLSPERDSNYIDVQDYYNWCGMVQLSSRFELYDIKSGKDFSMQVTPATWRTRVGPFFGWRWAFLGYNIDLKSLFMNSDDTDLSASIYSAAFGLDLFYRRVGGGYNIKNLVIAGNDYSPLLHGQPFNGLNFGMTRISFYYLTNYKHFSHQAAFNQTHRQLRSAGSPIFGFQYSHNRMLCDWHLLQETVNSINGTAYDNAPFDEKQSNNEYSLTGGYAYSWVFAKNFLAAGEMTGSIGYLVHSTSVTDNDNDKPAGTLKSLETFVRKNLSFSGNARISVLYNNGPWFAGSQGVFFYYQYGNANIQTRNLFGCFYVFVGFNF